MTYAEEAARNAAAKTNSRDDAIAGLRRACEAAAQSTHSRQVIYRAVRQELLSAGLTENGSKSMASKVATVATWLRNGGLWPAGGGLNAAYDLARKGAAGTSQGSPLVCPNCSHQWVP